MSRNHHGPWIDRPAPVRSGEDLEAEKLSAYLRQRLGLEGELEVEQFPRGFSNLTYLLRLGESQLVLRRPPFGAAIKSAHDMGREHRILSSLAEAYDKAPRPLLYCDDPEVLGAPFYVMERVEGVILRASMPPAMHPDPATMADIARSLVGTLAQLHAVDARGVGLGDLGRPEGYVRRQVEGWTRRYHAARTDDVKEMETVAAWLADHLPPDDAATEGGATLIHNDFKYDNVVLDPDDWTRVIAVLDWEMATLGDPLMDLGTSLGYWIDAGDPPEMQALSLSPTTLPGNPSRSQVAALYEAASGRPVDNVVFYYAFGLFKIAGIIQQIYARYRAGHTDDPRFAHLDAGVRGCAVAASQAIARRRIDDLFD